jgi:ABC-type polysaccharide/polyol phosphate export permease
MTSTMAVSHFSWLQSLRIVAALGWSDFILKYRGSVLGYLWSLLAPLAKFGVILVVFGPFVSSDIPAYPCYLFLGLIMWEHFAVTTSACLSMPMDKEAMIRRVPFPRILLIFSIGYTNALVFLAHFTVFVLGASWFGYLSWSPDALYMSLVLVQMTLVALGIGMILSAYSLKFKDVPHIWGVAVQILFWATPIIYPYRAEGTLAAIAASLTTNLKATSVMMTLVHIQPVSVLIHDAHRVLLYTGTMGAPSAEHAVGVTAVSLALFFLGALIFEHRSRYFSQEY